MTSTLAMTTRGATIDRMVWQTFLQHAIDVCSGQGDNCVSENEGGCRDLRKRVAKVVPKYHVFGHIHEGKWGFQ